MSEPINLTQLRESAETGLGPNGIHPVIQADHLLALIDTAEAAIEADEQGVGGYDFDQPALDAQRRLRETLKPYTTS